MQRGFFHLFWCALMGGISAAVKWRNSAPLFVCLFLWAGESMCHQQSSSISCLNKFVPWGRENLPLCFSKFLPALTLAGVSAAFVSLGRKSLCSLSEGGASPLRFNLSFEGVGNYLSVSKGFFQPQPELRTLLLLCHGAGEARVPSAKQYFCKWTNNTMLILF